MLELSQASVGGFRSKHDDGLDTISQLAMMNIWLPSGGGIIKPDNDVYSHYESEVYENSYVV